MQTYYAQNRLLLLRRLREEAAGAPLSELLRPADNEVRFRLGTSLADLRIPFSVADDFRAVVTRATIDAYLLLGQRHKASLPAGEHDALVVTEGFDPRALRPLGWLPPSSVRSESVRRAFSSAMEAHAGVDAGLVASFLGTGRPGRDLAAALHAVFVKAREESGRTGIDEPTPFLAALMLRQEATRSFALTRDAPVTGPMNGWLRGGVGALLHEAAQMALREAGVYRDAGLEPGIQATDPHVARTALRTLAALGLQPFLGRRPVLSAAGISAYGIAFDSAPPRLEELASRLARGEDAEGLVHDTALHLGRERELSRRLERSVAFASLRRHLRELSRLLDTAGTPALSGSDEGVLGRLPGGRDTLERLFASEARRTSLARIARDALRGVSGAEPRARLEVLAHAARDYREEEPAAWLGTLDARILAARALVALAADTLIERHAAAASGLMLERTGTETEGGGAAEYESGRLYLLTHTSGPFLKARLGPPQVGHLFCDVKDFTRRTEFLKESVIADFLQREFYAPILSAASGFDSGGRSMREPVALNNLLGDAVSFSGDIVALMRLTRDIQKTLQDYARRLAEEGSQEAVATRVRTLQADHRLRHEAHERQLRELQARIAGAEPEVRNALLRRARAIREEQQRQASLVKAELTRAAGEQLEAGIFLSFGAAPEVAQFEDPAFGRIKVAIAEKINESARGTARSAGVRARVDALLGRARRATGRPLELPFAVHVESSPTLSLLPEHAVAAEELLSKGDRAGAQALLSAAALHTMESRSAAGDLYNAGAALSGEALEAYLAAIGSKLIVIRKELPVASLAAALTERFFFPRPTLRFVACLSPASRTLAELFVLQGPVQFRGFEAAGGLDVYEIVDPSSRFFHALGKHHLADWIG